MVVAEALPRRNALVFASGSFAGNLLSRVVSAWLFYFYAAEDGDGDVTRRMPVWLVGAILTVTSLAGAFDDPLIGYWSDRTRSRWGRRIPFIVLATPPWVLLFVMLWTPPVAGESAANVVYLLMVLLAFRVVSTLSGAPMEALLPEVAPRNRDRVRIVVAQVLFATISAAVALIAAGPLIDLLGFQVMAGIMALLALGSRYLALGGVWRYIRRDVPPVTLSLVNAYWATFRNRQFLAFLPTFILFNMGITLMTAALPFFVEEILQPPENRGDLFVGAGGRPDRRPPPLAAAGPAAGDPLGQGPGLCPVDALRRVLLSTALLHGLPAGSPAADSGDHLHGAGRAGDGRRLRLPERADGGHHRL
jgi:GPH family glycoside/pentoside/hexuronide:cation symporter